MTDPVEAGREEIDGTDTVKVTGGVDAGGGLRRPRPAARTDGATVPPADLEAALQEGVVEAWIGTEDLRPRRVHIVLKGDGTGVAEGVGAIDLDLTADAVGLRRAGGHPGAARRPGARPRRAGRPDRRLAPAAGSIAPSSATLRRSKSSAPSGSSRNASTISLPIGGLVSRSDSASTLAWL